MNIGSKVRLGSCEVVAIGGGEVWLKRRWQYFWCPRGDVLA